MANACEKGESCCGVKNDCPLSENLSYFKVTAGFPPDVAYDYLEGVVPIELAGCFEIFIKKKYFTFDQLNKLIQKFLPSSGEIRPIALMCFHSLFCKEKNYWGKRT